MMSRSGPHEDGRSGDGGRRPDASSRSASVRSRLAIRASITNHRTRRDDLELLVREVVERGRKLIS